MRVEHLILLLQIHLGDLKAQDQASNLDIGELEKRNLIWFNNRTQYWTTTATADDRIKAILTLLAPSV